jgi:hypothetical protein
MCQANLLFIRGREKYHHRKGITVGQWKGKGKVDIMSSMDSLGAFSSLFAPPPVSNF